MQKSVLIAEESFEGGKKMMDSNEKSNKDIRWGWMGLFIVILVVISPLFSIYTIITSWNDVVAYDLFNLYPKFYLVCIIDLVVSIFLIIFSIYAGLSLYILKDRALFKAKLFLIIGLIYGIVAPFSIYFAGFPEDALYLASGEIGSSIFRSFIFFGIWYWFITSSKTVKRIYFDKQEPTNNRICPDCGRVIPFDANICPYCGKQF
jgi:hypothetical protein